MNKFLRLLLLPTILILQSPKPVKAEIDLPTKHLGTFLTLNACVQTARKAISSHETIKPQTRLSRTSKEFRWEIKYSDDDFLWIFCSKFDRVNRTGLFITASTVGDDENIDDLVSTTYQYLSNEIKIITKQY
ncbi:MAG: hypothetical protein WBB28_10810 [Crinalium sp.]